jgi:ribose/xylose/arabinose/galactoside ABC-type transport system permease subunit
MQTSTPANSIRHAVEPLAAPPRQMRFLAIWIALAVLVAICAVLLPRSVAPTTIQTILPFVAFLALASMGQAIVLMGSGIDLSVPGTVGCKFACNTGPLRGDFASNSNPL